MIPGSASPFFLGSSLAVGGGGAGYQIERSLRFNSSDSGFLSRTPAVAGNRRTWTWAGWVKRGKTSSLGDIIFAANQSYICFTGANSTGPNPDRIAFRYSTTSILVETAGVVRDFSAWFHLVVALDTTQTTSSDRVKIYVNGQLAALSSASYPSLSEQLVINDTVAHGLGRAFVSAGYDWDIFEGYLADIHFIDGQALTPSSFTEVSATTGQLIPLAYTGTFGTNGFWLKFSDNSAATAATLGNDYSGNNNDWTPNNLSVTAGAGNDSLVDTPTSFGTDTGVGGEVRGNYATLNPLQNGAGTLANGNLDMAGPASAYGTRVSTVGVSTGKWYFEATPTNGAVDAVLGITPSLSPSANIGNISDSYGASYGYLGNGSKLSNNSSSSYGASLSNNDVVGVAFDADAGTLTFYKNGSSQGTAYSSIPSKTYFLGVSLYATTNTCSVNFGQRAFAYTAPSGFKALCDTNLPAPLTAKPSTVMDVALYTGNGSTQTISGLGFEPGFVWIKNRSHGRDNNVYDAVRGATKLLSTNSTTFDVYNGTGTEQTVSGLTAFNSNGFNLGSDNVANQSSYTYAAWCWNAGTGSPVSNPDGSITSQVRANVSAGFSVVTYTGNNTSGATFGHGLGVTPQFFIVKNRSITGPGWVTYHVSLGATKYLTLNETISQQTYSGVWNNTAPTSTVITLGNDNGVNAGNNYVAYCFTPVVGYSSFGSYVGSGTSDGPFVYTGFRPRFVLAKRTDNTGDWFIWDAARVPYNQNASILWANSSNAETTNSGYGIDFLSNGFKLTGGSSNSNFGTLVYAAFAEAPFQYARAR